MNECTAKELADVLHEWGPRAADGATVGARGANFGVFWTPLGADMEIELEEADEEYLLLLPDVSMSLTWNGVEVNLPARSVSIVPPGTGTIRARAEAGRAIRLHAPISDEADAQLLSRSGQEVRGLEPRYRRIAGDSDVRVHVVDDYPASAGMPRARLFQSATLSINWVEYEGPRDRTRLSPHSHADFEQGSLAIEGDFVHHLRQPWTSDSTSWVPDAHLRCGPASLLVIPTEIIHTTEGVGLGHHLLIDIFAPPREDFISRGQILNAHEYTREDR